MHRKDLSCISNLPHPRDLSVDGGLPFWKAAMILMNLDF